MPFLNLFLWLRFLLAWGHIILLHYTCIDFWIRFWACGILEFFLLSNLTIKCFQSINFLANQLAPSRLALQPRWLGSHTDWESSASHTPGHTTPLGAQALLTVSEHGHQPVKSSAVDSLQFLGVVLSLNQGAPFSAHSSWSTAESTGDVQVTLWPFMGRPHLQHLTP